MTLVAFPHTCIIMAAVGKVATLSTTSLLELKGVGNRGKPAFSNKFQQILPKNPTNSNIKKILRNPTYFQKLNIGFFQ